MARSKQISAPGSRRLLDLPVAVLAIAVAFFAYRAVSNFVPAYYGLADEHGYLTTAKRVATTGHFALHQSDPYVFIGETYMEMPDEPSTFYLRQPLGYPVLCALAYRLAGASGPFVVNPLVGLLLLLGIYAVGRQLNHSLAGALAALVLAFHPIFLFYTVKPLSHIADLAIATATIAGALAWRKKQNAWRAILVGVLLGAAISVRYMNVLLVLPLAVVVIEQWRVSHPTVKRLFFHMGLAAGGTVLTLIPLFAYQSAAFGSPFRTGYSAGGNAGSFSAGYFFDHLAGMVQCIVQPSTGLTLLPGAAILAIFLLAKKERFTVALLVAWFLAPMIFYTAYYAKPSANLLLYARFSLTSYPGLLLLAFCWPIHLSSRIRRPGIAAAISLLLAGIAISISFFDPAMESEIHNMRNTLFFSYAAADMVESHTAPGSVILADKFTHYFLDYATEDVIYSPELFTVAPLQARLGDLDHSPHEFDPVRTRQLAKLLGGRSDAELAAILRKRLAGYAAGGRSVYLVCSVAGVSRWRERLEVPLILVADNPLEMGLYRLEFRAGTSGPLPGAPHR